MEVTWTATASAPSVKRFLLTRGVSKNLWERQKRQGGRQLLNGRQTTPDQAVSVGDQVTLIVADEPADDRILVSHEPVELVATTAHWLVANKPAGVSSVPGPTNQTDTMVNRIKGWLVANEATNLVPHLLTRLDRDTSGIMLVARDGLTQGLMTPQVEQHAMKKTYLALVAGQMPTKHDIIDAPIGRVPDQPVRQIDPAGQSAQTEYWVEETFATASLLRLQLHTGRTHQIRVHLTSLGHPLLGDELYEGPTELMKRQALHAASLSFVDPLTGEQQIVTAPLPADFEETLTQLRQAETV
ncbi:RluA family pseudouridine synthase [Furfurilactobacillus entadae]|uniref:RluA family pseudouridine synthase n=1 Tax=Furfurilactobacillus entadae TaxID=2922307 RepID=UPI0035E500B6